MTTGRIIEDRFGRNFHYLRVSITDVCNFRCNYCLPNGYKKTNPSSFLAHDEILRLVKAFIDLGIWKIRLTGGEPTIRKDFLDIVSAINDLPGVQKLAFTTNGYKLPARAKDFYQAGLRAVNISLDSLDANQFKKITGVDRFTEVLEGIHACIDAGFESVKINTVLLKSLNDTEFDDFINFVADKDISLRFIELMRTNDNLEYFKLHHLSGHTIVKKLLARGWQVCPRLPGAGPALEFHHPHSIGKIGLIAPYSKDFCTTCNRLRVSARGSLHLCLFGEGGFSLREYLQYDNQLDELKKKITQLMAFKRSSHFLHQGDSGTRKHFASIGG